MAEQDFSQSVAAYDDAILESDVLFDECMLKLSPDEHQRLYDYYREVSLLAQLGNLNTDDPVALSLCESMLRRAMGKFPADECHCFSQLRRDAQALLDVLDDLQHKTPTDAKLLLESGYTRIQARTDAVFFSLLLKNSEG